jgi:hypothetical protein
MVRQYESGARDVHQHVVVLEREPGGGHDAPGVERGAHFVDVLAALDDGGAGQGRTRARGERRGEVVELGRGERAREQVLHDGAAPVRAGLPRDPDVRGPRRRGSGERREGRSEQRDG